MKKLLYAVALAALVSGCALSPPSSTVVVAGNGACHPSQDLPTKKTMKKVPEVVTPLQDLFNLFASERKDHATDVRDYNSLYEQCVHK